MHQRLTQVYIYGLQHTTTNRLQSTAKQIYVLYHVHYLKTQYFIELDIDQVDPQVGFDRILKLTGTQFTVTHLINLL